MLPSHSNNYASNAWQPHAILFGEGPISDFIPDVLGANFSDLFLIELGGVYSGSSYKFIRSEARPMSVSARAIIRTCEAMLFSLGLSSLRDFIRHIVCGRSKEKMRGITARRVIAAVADEQPIRNISIYQFERDAVCRRRFPVKIKPSYAVAAFSACPIPAGVSAACSVHAVPEVDVLSGLFALKLLYSGRIILALIWVIGSLSQ